MRFNSYTHRPRFRRPAVLLCDRLLAGGTPELHFYTMNQAAPSTTIWQRLGL